MEDSVFFEKNIIYKKVKEDNFIDDNKKIVFNYFSKESFKNLMIELKKNIEIRTFDNYEVFYESFEYFFEYYDYYLLSEIQSLIISYCNRYIILENIKKNENGYNLHFYMDNIKKKNIKKDNIEKYINYTKNINEYQKKINFHYDGTKYNFNKIIEDISYQTELKTFFYKEDIKNVCKYLSQNFDKYLISNIDKLIIEINPIFAIEIINEKIDRNKNYSLLIHMDRNFMEEIDNIDNYKLIKNMISILTVFSISSYFLRKFY